MQAAQLVKCVVVGNSGVGKSSILFRYSNNEFDEFHEPTLGAAFVSKTEEINGKLVKFQIWDTAGQEKYQSIAPIYYRQSEIALCVYDISNRNSFAVVNKWVKQLQDNGPKNMMLVIVGNKCDKTEQEQVTYQQGKQYSDSVNGIFKLTSAKEGKGINDMFVAIGETYLERKQMRGSTGQGSKQGKEQVQLGGEGKKKKRRCCE